MDGVWQRIVDGKPSVVLGVLPNPPEHVPAFELLRIDARHSERALGVLAEARERIEQLLAESEVHEPAAQRVWSGLRRRLLGELPERDPAQAFVDAANRLRKEAPRLVAICVVGVEFADAASLELLQRILARPGWLRLPLVLEWASGQRDGPARALADAVEASDGPEAVFTLSAPESRRTTEGALADLPTDARRVLRAAALIGSSFDVPLVAELLEASELEVLYALQRARDHGVLLRDGGGGRIAIPEPMADALRRELLPSLTNAWHKRLARLLAARARPRRADPAVAPRRRDAATTEPPFASSQHSAPSEPPPSLAVPPRAEPRRAARHAEASGDLDLAVEQYVEAAHRAVENTEYAHGTELAKKALELLAQGGVSAKRRLLRVLALLALARVRFRGAVPHEASSLGDALELLGECDARLLPGDPAEIRAEVLALSAAIHYDMGDTRSLEAALRELGEASHALLKAGKPVDAARLLNDEAAVWVRVGDAVRAHHLLQKSREIFQERAAHDPVARLEMAETDHLLGRLVLHAPPRPGHEREAIEVGIQQATRAEAVFRELDRPRELGRLWETLGRLELARGNTRAAVERLLGAADVQQHVSDFIGLARTTAALADIALESGNPARAIELLESSIELNREKGSPLGLAFNRRALGSLVRRLTEPERHALIEVVDPVARKLEAAEVLLGRVEIPSEAWGMRSAERPRENE